MASLVQSPAQIIPARDAKITFNLDQPGANFVRVWCVEAPDGSIFSNALKQSAAATPRTLVYEGEGSAVNPWLHRFDRGGKYGLQVQEYNRGGSVFGGGYQDDARGAPLEQKLSTEYSLALYVGKRFTQTVGVAPDTASLAFWVFADTIQATTLALHGENTPVIEKPSTPKAKGASQTGSVTTALSALVGVTASTAIGGGALNGALSNFVTQFNNHLGNTVAHQVADTTNPLKTEIGVSPSPQSLPTFAIQALRSFRQHITNDSGSGVGTAATAWHTTNGTTATGDMVDLPLARGAGGVEDAVAVVADLWRAYEAHRLNAGVHKGTADTTSVLAALPKLLDVHRYFLAALAATVPTAAPGDSSGLALLKNWGFKEG